MELLKKENTFPDFVAIRISMQKLLKEVKNHTYFHIFLFVRVDQIHQDDRIEYVSVKREEFQKCFKKFWNRVTGGVDQFCSFRAARPVKDLKYTKKYQKVSKSSLRRWKICVCQNDFIAVSHAGNGM